MKKGIVFLLIGTLMLSVVGCSPSENGMGGFLNGDANAGGNAGDEIQLTEEEQIAQEYIIGSFWGDKEITYKHEYYNETMSDKAVNNPDEFFESEERYIKMMRYEDVEINSWEDFYTYYREAGKAKIKLYYGEDVVYEVTPARDYTVEGIEKLSLEFFLENEYKYEEEAQKVLDKSLFTESTVIFMNAKMIQTAEMDGVKKQRVSESYLAAWMVKYDGEWKVIDVDPVEVLDPVVSDVE